MSATFEAATGLLAQLDLLHISQRDAIVQVRLNRPAKRNAINDPTVRGIEAFFTAPPDGIRAVVLDAEGRVAASVQGRIPTTQTLVSIVERVLGE